MIATRRLAAVGAASLIVLGAIAVPLATASGALVDSAATLTTTTTAPAQSSAEADDLLAGETDADGTVSEEIADVEDTVSEEVTAAESLVAGVTGAEEGQEPDGGGSEPSDPAPSEDAADDAEDEDSSPASSGNTSPPFADLRSVEGDMAPTTAPGITVARSAPASGGVTPAAVEPGPAEPAATPEAGDAAPLFQMDFASGATLTDLPEARPVSPSGRSTRAFYDLIEGLGLAPQLVARLLAPFPVAGKAHYSDDWLAHRSTPAFHLHEGTDVFAAKGTPVIAAADGIVERMVRNSAVGGTSLRLTTADGTFYYYAHLDRFAPKLAEGERVQKGDVLGFVGTTGNASATAPHLHFEIHPGGGEAVSPVPYLDRWLGEALQAARTVAGAPVSQSALRHASSASGAAASAPPPEADGTDVSDARPISSSTALPAAGVLALIAIGWKVRRALTRRARLRVAVADAAPLRFSEADLLRFAEELADEAVTAGQR